MMPDHQLAVAQELLLHDADFPSHFVHMHHPDDAVISSTPITEFIEHIRPHHHRLIVRISWWKSDAEFVPMTFVCDTGAPMGFYLSDEAWRVLESIGRIEEDDRSGIFYIRIRDVGVAAVDETPAGHSPANIMGLTILRRVGLNIDPSTGRFRFLAAPSSW